MYAISRNETPHCPSDAVPISENALSFVFASVWCFVHHLRHAASVSRIRITNHHGASLSTETQPSLLIHIATVVVVPLFVRESTRHVKLFASNRTQ